jgi:hypothetical protein
MPFISSEETKAVRDRIKKTFPEYKFSITKRNHMALHVDVLQGPMEMKSKTRTRRDSGEFVPEKAETYSGVNTYYINDHWEDKTAQFLSKLKETIYGVNPVTIEHEDSDYGFIPNYFLHVNIGKWDKPYTVTSKNSI